MASTQTKNASNRRSDSDRKNTNALIQWMAIIAVFVLGLVAVFVFEIGGTRHGGAPGASHSGAITGQLN